MKNRKFFVLFLFTLSKLFAFSLFDFSDGVAGERNLTLDEIESVSNFIDYFYSKENRYNSMNDMLIPYNGYISFNFGFYNQSRYSVDELDNISNEFISEINKTIKTYNILSTSFIKSIYDDPIGNLFCIKIEVRDNSDMNSIETFLLKKYDNAFKIRSYTITKTS